MCASAARAFWIGGVPWGRRVCFAPIQLNTEIMPLQKSTCQRNEAEMPENGTILARSELSIHAFVDSVIAICIIITGVSVAL